MLIASLIGETARRYTLKRKIQHLTLTAVAADATGDVTTYNNTMRRLVWWSAINKVVVGIVSGAGFAATLPFVNGSIAHPVFDTCLIDRNCPRLRGKSEDDRPSPTRLGGLIYGF